METSLEDPRHLLSLLPARGHKVNIEREAGLLKNTKYLSQRILIVKTESSEVSIVDVQQEEVGREFPAEYCQVEEGTGEMGDTSRLLQQSRTNTFRYWHHHHLRSTTLKYLHIVREDSIESRIIKENLP